MNRILNPHKKQPFQFRVNNSEVLNEMESEKIGPKCAKNA